MTDKVKKPKTRKPNVGSDPTKGRRVWFWQVGLYVFAIGSSTMLMGITLLRLIQGRFTTAPAVAALVVTGMTWGLLKLVSEQGTIDPGGLRVGTAEPELTAFMHDIADQVGAPQPHAIYLVADALLTVSEETRHFGLSRGERALIIGLPLLHSMSKREFSALAAHHLCHYAESDVGYGKEAMCALRNASDLIKNERDGAVNAVYGSYARKIFRSVGGVGVAHEHAAEQTAIDAYGSAAMKSGLMKIDDAAVAWDQFLRDYMVPALQNDAHPLQVFEGFTQVLRSESRAEGRADEVVNRRNGEGNEFDPHNSPGERLQILETWPEAAGTVELDDPHGAASSLLDPEAKSSEIVVAKWAHNLMGKHTEPQTWKQLNDQVFCGASQTLASKGFDTPEELTGAEQLDQVLGWVDSDWATLDEKLRRVKVLKGDNLERRLTWTQAVVVEAAAASNNYTWCQNWDGPPKLVTADGTLFDPAPVAELVAAGDTTQARTTFDSLVDSAR